MTIADLEIRLERNDADTYSVELKFMASDSEAESVSGRQLVRFDFNHLLSLALDDIAYGQLLSRSLFAELGTRKAFAGARANAQAARVPLRVRLFIGLDAPELHSLRWETLRDPETPQMRCYLANISSFPAT